jgi:hypothetical protein
MMNAPGEEKPLHDERLFDRLADGELDERQRQALLSSLDRQPDGWRQCALALLEAQCWRNEMTTLARQAAAYPPSGSAAGKDDRPCSEVGPATLWGDAQPADRFDSRLTALPVRERLGRRGAAAGMPRAGRFVAVAAGLLLAFSLGMAARDVLFRHGPSDDRAAGSAKTSLAVDAAPPLADTPPHGGPQRSAEQEQVAAAEQSTGPRDIEPELSGDTLTFLVRTGQGSTTKQVHVPLVSAEGIRKAGVAPAWLAARQSPLPDPVLRQLEQTGHQVHWRRRYAPVQLDDGRQVVFPVDDLEIAPVVCETL